MKVLNYEIVITSDACVMCLHPIFQTFSTKNMATQRGHRICYIVFSKRRKIVIWIYIFCVNGSKHFVQDC